MAQVSTMRNPLNPGEPRLRRGYFECRYGQLHVHSAIPPGGGFDEGVSLLCLHPAGTSGRMFQSFLPLMGADRSVYAPDMPGCGESDAPLGPVGAADYAAAIGDFLDSMRLRQIDVLGYQAGAQVAVELALARPKQIRQVVLVSAPEVTRERAKTLTPRPLTLQPREDKWEAVAMATAAKDFLRAT